MKREKPFEKWTWEELVDYWAGDILKGLIAGQFRQRVWAAMDSTIRWRNAQEEEDSK